MTDGFVCRARHLDPTKSPTRSLSTELLVLRSRTSWTPGVVFAEVCGVDMPMIHNAHHIQNLRGPYALVTKYGDADV